MFKFFHVCGRKIIWHLIVYIIAYQLLVYITNTSILVPPLIKGGTIIYQGWLKFCFSYVWKRVFCTLSKSMYYVLQYEIYGFPITVWIIYCQYWVGIYSWYINLFKKNSVPQINSMQILYCKPTNDLLANSKLFILQFELVEFYTDFVMQYILHIFTEMKEVLSSIWWYQYIGTSSMYVSGGKVESINKIMADITISIIY